jgi:hypothetical protein
MNILPPFSMLNVRWTSKHEEFSRLRVQLYEVQCWSKHVHSEYFLKFCVYLFISNPVRLAGKCTAHTGPCSSCPTYSPIRLLLSELHIWRKQGRKHLCKVGGVLLEIPWNTGLDVLRQSLVNLNSSVFWVMMPRNVTEVQRNVTVQDMQRTANKLVAFQDLGQAKDGQQMSRFQDLGHAKDGQQMSSISGSRACTGRPTNE